MNKPKIELLALCNYASFNNVGSMSVIDIFDEIYVDTFPASFPRCFLALVLSHDEPDITIALKIQITLENVAEMTLEKEVSVTTGPNSKGNFLLEMVNLNLIEAGVYTIKVLHEDKEIGSINFSVLQNKLPPVKNEEKYIN